MSISLDNFQDTDNPICNCGEDIETSSDYFLHRPVYSNIRLTLLNVINNIDTRILERNDSEIIKLSLYGKAT